MAKKDDKKIISPTAVPPTGKYSLPIQSASKVAAAARKARPQTAPTRVEVPKLTVSQVASTLAKILQTGGKFGA